MHLEFGESRGGRNGWNLRHLHYIFAQFKVHGLYHKVRFTRGVYSVVRFGQGPEEVIMLIRSNIKEDGFVRIDEEIKPGDRVAIG